MQYIIGIILLVTFFYMVYYCAKGYNLMVGFLIMATVWTALALLGNALSPTNLLGDKSIVDTIINVYQKAPEGFGPVLVNILWGAWFGRILLETGIASTIIRKTVELGGDKPGITLTLVNIVTVLLFTSMNGAGPVISIAVIVIPIFLSLGIPKVVALLSFMGSVTAGSFINPVLFNQYIAFFVPYFGDKTGKMAYTYNMYIPYGMKCVGILFIMITIFANIYMAKKKVSYSWAAQSGQVNQVKNAPNIALFAPIIPVIFAMIFHLPVIFGFLVGGFYALILCGKLKDGFANSCRIINKLFTDGVGDTAPLMGFLLTMACFNTASKYCAPFFKSVIGGYIPTSALVLCIMFAVLAPLGWFRGPLVLFGSGAATLAVIATSSAHFPITLLYPLYMIPTLALGGIDITISYVAWGLGYTKVAAKDYMKAAIIPAWISAIIMAIVAYVTLV